MALMAVLQMGHTPWRRVGTFFTTLLLCVKTPVDDSQYGPCDRQYGPCNQSDARECQPLVGRMAKDTT
jgi:hypothetical protein